MKGTICLSHKKYLQKVLSKFDNNKSAKPVITLLVPHFKLSSKLSPYIVEEHKFKARVPYANAVRSLTYAKVCSKSDISQLIILVSRYMHNSGKGYWQAIKLILWYILNTIDGGLKFEQGKDLVQSVGYVDLDFAGDLDKHRLITWYLFTFAKALVS